MRSLDICIACGKGVLLIQRSRRIPSTPWLKRYLRCDHCGAHDSEIVIAGPPRHRRGKSVSMLEPTAAENTTPQAILTGERTENFRPRPKEQSCDI